MEAAASWGKVFSWPEDEHSLTSPTASLKTNEDIQFASGSIISLRVDWDGCGKSAINCQHIATRWVFNNENNQRQSSYNSQISIHQSLSAWNMQENTDECNDSTLQPRVPSLQVKGGSGEQIRPKLPKAWDSFAKSLTLLQRDTAVFSPPATVKFINWHLHFFSKLENEAVQAKIFVKWLYIWFNREFWRWCPSQSTGSSGEWSHGSIFGGHNGQVAYS